MTTNHYYVTLIILLLSSHSHSLVPLFEFGFTFSSFLSLALGFRPPFLRLGPLVHHLNVSLLVVLRFFVVAVHACPAHITCCSDEL